LSVTEAVLSRHAEPQTPPLSAPADVLSVGNAQIRPSPSHEFKTSDNLIIFFKIYNAMPGPGDKKPMIGVTLTLMKDAKTAIKPLEYQLSEIEAEPVPHITFAKYVKLAGLATGKYSAVIEVRDMVQNKSARQEAHFVITK